MSGISKESVAKVSLKALVHSPLVEIRRAVQIALSKIPTEALQIVESKGSADLDATLDTAIDLIVMDGLGSDVVSVRRLWPASAIVYLCKSADHSKLEEATLAAATEIVPALDEEFNVDELCKSTQRALRYYHMQQEHAHFAEILKERDRQVMLLTQRLQRSSPIDERTCWFRRPIIQDRLTEEVNRARRYALPLSLVAIELSNLSKVHEQFGGDGLDEIIIEVTTRISRVARKTDLFGHWGTDSFLVILTNTDENGSHIFCKRVTSALEREFQAGEHKVKLPFCFGVYNYMPSRTIRDAEIVDILDARLAQAAKIGDPGAIVMQ